MIDESVRQWLFKTVTAELNAEGFAGISLRETARAGGMDVAQMRELFPDTHALLFALVDEISGAHRDFILQACQEVAGPQERLVRFVISALAFVNQNPALAHVIVIALLGSDPLVKERVHEAYGQLFALMLDDLVAAGILSDRSPLLVADLTTVLLSVVFLGGSPQLHMDYLSFVYPRNVALSALEALRKRYAAHWQESPVA
jgi:AcrR family transcriptional regulator